MKSPGALAVVIGLVACTTTPPPAKPEPAMVGSGAVGSGAVGSPAPRPSASPAPAKVDTSSWEKDWPTTWTDSRVVDALAQKCDFAPTGAQPRADGFDRPGNIFQCTIGHSQSCNPDYCFSAGDRCERDCTKTCLDCGGACATSCESCKRECKDASCMHTCAETCAECKDSCEAKLDHCATAECGKKHADCEKTIRASWKRGGCSAKCTRFRSCSAACDKAKDPDRCRETCEAQLAPGWKACNDKCEALGAADRSEEASACLGDCYATVPCAPFVCQVGVTP